MRKRLERSRDEEKQYAVTRFARDLLTVADNLTRALAATPADASGTMYCARPAVTPSPAPGSCRLWVTSKMTGHPSSRMIGNARMSTTRLL